MVVKPKESHLQFYRDLVQRQRLLVGEKTQSLIRRSKVCIVGLGANGASAAEALVRMGVEDLVVADPDTVELSNLNRQLYDFDDVGTKKAFATVKRLTRINPYVGVKADDTGLNAENSDGLLKGCRVVIDAADDYRAKVILCRKAKSISLPEVHSAGAGHRGSVTTFLHTGITYEEMFGLPSVGRPVEAVSDQEFLEHRRKVARIIGKGMYSAEANERMNRPEQPWHTMMPACVAAGTIAAMEAVKILIQREDKVIAAPRILQIDVWNNTYTVFEFGRNGAVTSYSTDGD